jgi:hypothetical protein
VFDDGRLNRLLELEGTTAARGAVYTLAAMLGDVRRGIWSELGAAQPAVDVFRRGLQNNYIALLGRKINPPAPAAGAAAGVAAGPAAQQLSEDARSHLRGELVTLRDELRRAIPRTQDRPTQLHLQAAVVRIGEILEPRR